MNKVLLAISLALLASATLLPISDGSTPRKEDIPYIKCQVCEKLASRLHQLVNKKQEQISPKKISEYKIIEIAENICDLNKDEADWILKIDIVEKGHKLELVEQEEEGMCDSECKTIQAACLKVIGYKDTDVAEYIYKSKPNLASLINHLCKDITDACSEKPPPVPKNRVPGEPFVVKPPKDQEVGTETFMTSIDGTPAPAMRVLSSEDLDRYRKTGKLPKGYGKVEKHKEEVEDDEEDDEDDEDKDSINLGEDSTEKVENWKKTIRKKIEKRGKARRAQRYEL